MNDLLNLEGRICDNEPEEEHFKIDFDRLLLIGRIRLGIPADEVDKMTLGKWSDLFYSYKELYNFEAKGNLYADVEREMEQYRLQHQPVTSV